MDSSNSLREDNTSTRFFIKHKTSLDSYHSRMFEGRDYRIHTSKSFITDFGRSRKSSLHEEIALFKTIPLHFHILLLLVYIMTCTSGYYALFLPNTLQKPLLDIGVSASDTIRLKTIFSVAGLITLPISGIIINKIGDGPSIL